MSTWWAEKSYFKYANLSEKNGVVICLSARGTTIISDAAANQFNHSANNKKKAGVILLLLTLCLLFRIKEPTITKQF